MNILLFYLLPRFYYSLHTPHVSRKSLSILGKVVRRTVKQVLHLPLQTLNAFLYADRQGGGLGIPPLLYRIPDILMSRMDKLAVIADLQVVSALNTPFFLRLREWLHDIVHFPGVGSASQRAFWRGKFENLFSGAGLPTHSKVPCAHTWLLSPPPSWTGGDYVAAVHLRCNMLPTRGGLHNKQLPFANRVCRAGYGCAETLSHVLQKCPATHYQRIKRHDHVVKIFSLAATKKGWEVEKEPQIRDRRGLLKKPDSVLYKDGELLVVDVSVNWEAPNKLTWAYHHKVATYLGEDFI